MKKFNFVAKQRSKQFVVDLSIVQKNEMLRHGF